MTDTNLLNLAQILAFITVAALSAIAASGLTTLALIAFFRNLLGSPAALKLVEGLVNSFPPDTRELINVIARFVETVSEYPNPPAAGSLPQGEPPGPTPTQGAAKTLSAGQGPSSSVSMRYSPYAQTPYSVRREQVKL